MRKLPFTFALVHVSDKYLMDNLRLVHRLTPMGRHDNQLRVHRSVPCPIEKSPNALVFAGLICLCLSVNLPNGQCGAQSRRTEANPAASSENEWPMFKHDLKRTRFSPSKAPSTADIVWERKIPGARRFWSSPCLVEGKLYVGNENGNFYCADAATGELLWTFFTNTGQPVFSSPAVSQGLVFFAGYEMIYALPSDDPDRDGTITADEMAWSFRVGKSTGRVNNVMCRSPAIHAGKLYLGAVDQYF